MANEGSPEVKALDAWNEQVYIDKIAEAGFPGSSVHTDESFRFHLFNFQVGIVARAQENAPPPPSSP